MRLALAWVVLWAWGPLLAAQTDSGQWEPLFNGRDLNGWRQIGGRAPFAVVEGTIVGTTTANTPNSFLATEHTYGDFILELEVRQDVAPTNSGVQFRSAVSTHDSGERVTGYQCEIDPSQRAWTGGIYDEARRGWLYPGTLNPAARDLYEFGRWNLIRIEAIGNSLRTWVNGRPVAHVVDDASPEGFIALQVHSVSGADQAGRIVAWRNIRIQTRNLRASPPEPVFVRNLIPNHVHPAEEARGWRLLWDGQSTRGWRGAGGAAFPANAWQITDGVLVAQATTSGAGPANLLSNDRFGAFELQLDFKLPPGAESGIGYRVADTPAGDPTPVVLREYQLVDDAALPKSADAAAAHGLAALFDLIPRDRMPGGQGIVPRVGEWQHARIVVPVDGVVEHWLNGIRVVEYQENAPLFRALLALRAKGAADVAEAMETSPILLQHQGTTVSFRSIKVRPLE